MIADRIDGIASPLKDIRRSRGLTREQVARIIGSSDHYLYLVESGRRPVSPAMRQSLARLYGVAPVEIRS